ncbi:MAG: GNAT family N-acetyltransferase [Parvularculaceae bacterium]|nr:GNAT family N-acetyltransferase [Parvularculaceae bacterium]
MTEDATTLETARPAVRFTHRVAARADIPAIMALIEAAIVGNMAAFLTPREVEAARATMGLDTLLIDDGCYFLIEARTATGGVLAGCGGWSRRRTLYGGDRSAGRDDNLSDPASDPARIRAMYTHPDWTRRGVGSMLLDLGEAAARAEGFKTIELGATIPGEPLYRARGYAEFGRDETVGTGGVKNVIIRMRKIL